MRIDFNADCGGFAYREAHSFVLSCGKHRGKPLHKVPVSYLKYMQSHWDMPEDLLEAVEIMIDQEEWDSSGYSTLDLHGEGYD